MPTDAYIGIDLGTTNSAVTCFCDGELTVLRDASGRELTPSAVAIDATGRAVCGRDALDILEAKPGRARAEHKRLMGSRSPFQFEDGAPPMLAEELAAVVLRKLAVDVEAALGHPPRAAVISIPALFELPQSEATARAARQAGFERVELVQEPVAAALAASWGRPQPDGRRLVFDIGGGTFDASIVETSEGFSRVVAHTGDPFLGGRDIDTNLLRTATRRAGFDPAQLEPDERRRLRRAIEAAKIELASVPLGSSLARQLQWSPSSANAAPGGLELHADDLALATRPVLARAFALVESMCRTHALRPEQFNELVLVGGPTLAACVRDEIAARWGIPVAAGVDPLTVVARGAAIFAATSRLRFRGEASPESEPSATTDPRRPLWLRHPVVTTSLGPHLVARFVGDALIPREVVATRDDGHQVRAPFTHGGDVSLALPLVAQRRNRFTLHLVTPNGEVIAAQPEQIHITHGVTLDEPPLGASVGVALADDGVRRYFAAGTPLPARRVFRHRSVEHLGPNTPPLRIPIVQGEYDRAHLCRPVGELRIDATHLAGRQLPAGSELEISLELDRSGRLSARAKLPGRLGVVEGLERLLVPEASSEVVFASLDDLEARLAALRGAAFRLGTASTLPALRRLDEELRELRRELVENDEADGLARVRRAARELDAEIGAREDEARFDDVAASARATLTWANTWVSLRGTPRERSTLSEVADAMQAAAERLDGVDLQRQQRLAAQLGESAWLRDPAAWSMLFEHYCGVLDGALDLPRAQALVERGRDAVASEDWGSLRSVVERLRPLMPVPDATRRLAHGSGVR